MLTRKSIFGLTLVTSGFILAGSNMAQAQSWRSTELINHWGNGRSVRNYGEVYSSQSDLVPATTYSGRPSSTVVHHHYHYAGARPNRHPGHILQTHNSLTQTRQPIKKPFSDVQVNRSQLFLVNGHPVHVNVNQTTGVGYINY